MLDNIIRKQTHITRHELSHKQPEEKTNRSRYDMKQTVYSFRWCLIYM